MIEIMNRKYMRAKNSQIKKYFTLLHICFFLLLNANNVFTQNELYLDDREDFAKKANVHFQKGDWETGKKVLDEGLLKYPQESDLKMLLGKYYVENKNYDQARFQLMEALKYNKNNVEAKQILVNVEIETQRYSSAICYINELLEINPYWKGLWRKKIDVYRLQGNNVEANRLLKRISQIYPDDTSIKATYLYYVEQEAASKKNEGRIKEAIDLSAVLVEEDPYNEDFYLDLVNNYLKSGDYEKALINVEKGLFNLSHSLRLMDKKMDILAEQHHYDRILSFIQIKIKEGNNRQHLERRYNYFLEEAARYHRQSDPYTLYKILYDRDPKNEEAFNYIVTNAIANGFYEDALEVINKAKDIQGETKALLAKEQHVYECMGAQAKANQTTIRMYQLFPDDADITEQYTLYRLSQAKSNMQDGLYEKALNHWRFIVEYGDEELKKTALISIYNCSYQLGRFDESLTVLDWLIREYPDELEWGVKRADVYAKQNKYTDALHEYERVLYNTDPLDMEYMLVGYEELATICTKQLIESYLLKDAIKIIEHWLRINPKSDLGIRYGINVAAQMKDYEKMRKFTLMGTVNKPEDTYYQMKLAEAYNINKNYEQSLEILTPEVIKNPYHKELIGTYSQSREDYARKLIIELEYNEALAALDSALLYDPSNKSLKYWKGIAYEKIHQYDSAYYYQSFYEPALLEVKEFSNHLKYLKNRMYKNEVGFHYLRSRFGEIDRISSISTVEYIRFFNRDTYTGRVNYAGRQNNKGIQGQLEWSRLWRNDISTRTDIAVANKVFSSFIINGSVYKTFKYEWEAEIGAGYRRLEDKKNMVNIVGGVAKELDKWWLNARFNNFIIDSDWYYSLVAQTRFYLPHPKSYLTVMASVGSAPDVEIIDNQLYDGFSVTNTMVGLGGRFLINESLSAGLLGTCYNYKDTSYNYEEQDGKYRNLYNIYVQLYVNF